MKTVHGTLVDIVTPVPWPDLTIPSFTQAPAAVFWMSRLVPKNFCYFLIHAGTNLWTTSRSYSLCGRPLKTCSPRHTQGNRIWPSWVMCRPASGGSAGRTCSNSWTMSASLLLLRSWRGNPMVGYEKEWTRNTLTVDCIEKVNTVLVMCWCSYSIAGAVGGIGCQADPDPAADHCLWDHHGLCLCRGKKQMKIMLQNLSICSLPLPILLLKATVSEPCSPVQSIMTEAALLPLYSCVGGAGPGSEKGSLDPFGWN